MQLLRKITFPFSLAYAAIVCLRNRFYDIGFFSSRTFKTPILCVGNLNVGGTGKTPMIALLLSLLESTQKMAVLSRGYGRSTRGFRWVTRSSTALEAGDEPLQLATAFPEVTVAVDANRRRGITYLETQAKPDLILLDDGFQHRKVKPWRNILLTSCHNLYCDDNYLPAGTLRDCRDQARRADLIVVTKCPADMNVERQRILDKLRPEKHQQVLFATLAYDLHLRGTLGSRPLHWLRNKDVTLVTGIADSDPLLLFLQGEGISFFHMNFGDHHRFTKAELSRLAQRKYILTTEKDFMRLKGKVQGEIYYIRVQHLFLGNDLAKFKEWLGLL